MLIPAVIAYCIFGYLFGAIPTAFIMAKKLKGIDIREHGSGNVGATNLRRVVGTKPGIICMILDILKGVFVVLVGEILFHKSVDPWQIVPVLGGIMAIIGHSKSVYIGFSGGKSVNTSLGAFLALEPIVGIIVTLLAFGVIKVTRIVSTGSIFGAVGLLVGVIIRHGPLSHIILTSFICVFVIYLHRSNIQRMLHGQENRL